MKAIRITKTIDAAVRLLVAVTMICAAVPAPLLADTTQSKIIPVNTTRLQPGMSPEVLAANQAANQNAVAIQMAAEAMVSPVTGTSKTSTFMPENYTDLKQLSNGKYLA
jgi:hypothetical protein